MVKLTYFDLFGRAEPMRMALWKAGVEFEDIRVSGEAWTNLKATGELEFGQVPMLELDDGTKLFQSGPIVRYLGHKYNLMPTDPIANYRGEKAVEHMVGDF